MTALAVAKNSYFDSSRSSIIPPFAMVIFNFENM
jgi:hypothetical protein